MGHLARCSALVSALEPRGFCCNVILRVDEQGRSFARDRGLTEHEFGLGSQLLSARTVVIDALNIPEDDVAYLLESKKRILVSPVCDAAGIATAVFVRAISEEMRRSLPANCLLVADPQFAFVTASGLTPRELNYQDGIVVGVCLSGGKEQPAVGGIIDTAKLAPDVLQVYAITPPRTKQLNDESPVYYLGFADNPWSALSQVNVFVGGDGVMISEAVSQGLPCISVITPGFAQKNRRLVEAGCVKICTHDDAQSTLAMLLRDKKRLAVMHEIALEEGRKQDVDALPRNIERAVLDDWSV